MRQTEPHQSAGLKAQPPRYQYRTTAYDQFQVIYVMNGVLFFETAGTARLLEPNTVLILREGSGFRLFTREKGYDGIFYVSAGEDEPALHGDCVALQAPPDMRALAKVMYAEARAPEHGSRDVLLGLGRAIAWQAIRLDEAGREKPGEQDYGRRCAERARVALDLSLYDASQGAREVLSGIGLSYRQLSRYFQAAFGMSPKQYQLQARVREAGQLLKNTTQPVTSIALELGFASSQHFATQFAAMTGKSPSAWREERTTNRVQGVRVQVRKETNKGRVLTSPPNPEPSKTKEQPPCNRK